jgi:hypothetical protein
MADPVAFVGLRHDNEAITRPTHTENDSETGGV